VLSEGWATLRLMLRVHSKSGVRKITEDTSLRGDRVGILAMSPRGIPGRFLGGGQRLKTGIILVLLNTRLTPAELGMVLQVLVVRPCTASFEPGRPRLLLVQIFVWNIVLWHLVRANFLLVGVPSAFHASHDVGLERVSFLD
jgi:hypothetical protein